MLLDKLKLGNGGAVQPPLRGTVPRSSNILRTSHNSNSGQAWMRSSENEADEDDTERCGFARRVVQEQAGAGHNEVVQFDSREGRHPEGRHLHHRCRCLLRSTVGSCWD
jgi:hypothetical protein